MALFKNLRAEMARHDVSVGNLADVLNVRYATASDKLNGRSRFYYEEVEIIRNTFFPKMSIEYLFAKEHKNSA